MLLTRRCSRAFHLYVGRRAYTGNKRKTVVIALGGNALLRKGEQMTQEMQARNAGIAAQAIAEIAKDQEWNVILTHG